MVGSGGGANAGLAGAKGAVCGEEVRSLRRPYFFLRSRRFFFCGGQPPLRLKMMVLRFAKRSSLSSADAQLSRLCLDRVLGVRRLSHLAGWPAANALDGDGEQPGQVRWGKKTTETSPSAAPSSPRARGCPPQSTCAASATWQRQAAGRPVPLPPPLPPPLAARFPPAPPGSSSLPGDKTHVPAHVPPPPTHTHTNTPPPPPHTHTPFLSQSGKAASLYHNSPAPSHTRSCACTGGVGGAYAGLQSAALSWVVRAPPR